MMKYKKYIKILKELSKELNESEEYFHLGGDVDNLIEELENIEED